LLEFSNPKNYAREERRKKPDLANQIAALQTYCNEHEIKVNFWMQDIGSGLNYKGTRDFR
jgi:predicted site-specific integrase-resolvase